jgi:hypothetical protein
MSGGAVAGPVEGVPGWHVPTTFPHITNFVSNPLAALLLSADLPLSVSPSLPLPVGVGVTVELVTQVCAVPCRTRRSRSFGAAIDAAPSFVR